MNSTVENVLITAGSLVIGTIIGIVTTIFGDEIKGWLGWAGYTNRDLRGKWNCSWLIEWPKQRGSLVDTLLIARAGRREVLARGTIETQEHGLQSYELRGSFSRENVLTLIYEMTKFQNLTGTVILKLNPKRNRFEGFWLQISPSGEEIVGGSCVWRKI